MTFSQAYVAKFCYNLNLPELTWRSAWCLTAHPLVLLFFRIASSRPQLWCPRSKEYHRTKAGASLCIWYMGTYAIRNGRAPCVRRAAAAIRLVRLQCLYICTCTGVRAIVPHSGWQLDKAWSTLKNILCQRAVPHTSRLTVHVDDVDSALFDLGT
jgi:hypothetical protein